MLDEHAVVRPTLRDTVFTSTRPADCDTRSRSVLNVVIRAYAGTHKSSTLVSSFRNGSTWFLFISKKQLGQFSTFYSSPGVNTNSIRSHASFVLSFLAIVALGVFYEWLRFFARKVDRSVARSILAGKGNGKNKGVSGTGTRGRSPSPASASPDEDAGLLTGSSVPRRKGVQLYVRCSPNFGNNLEN